MHQQLKQILSVFSQLLLWSFVSVVVLTGLFWPPVSQAAIASDQTAPTLAYRIDWDKDKARQEKTVEHYGEGVRPIVEDAQKNNAEHPQNQAVPEEEYSESKGAKVIPQPLKQFWQQNKGEVPMERGKSPMEKAQ